MVKFAQIVSIIIATVTLFLFTNQDAYGLTSIAPLTWNFAVLGAFGNLVIQFSYEKVEYFNVEGRKIIDDFAIGAIWGAAVYFLFSYIVPIGSIVNLTGSIPTAEYASIAIPAFLFTVLIQPFTESQVFSVLTYTGYTTIDSFLNIRIPVLNWNLSKVLAVVGIALLFSAFHFAVYGAANFTPDWPGFVKYFQTQGYDSNGLPIGGLGVFYLGLAFGLLFFAYRSWIVMTSAHLINNLLATVAINQALHLPLESYQILLLLLGIVGIFLYFHIDRYKFDKVQQGLNIQGVLK